MVKVFLPDNLPRVRPFQAAIRYITSGLRVVFSFCSHSTLFGGHLHARLYVRCWDFNNEQEMVHCLKELIVFPSLLLSFLLEIF